MARGVFSAVFDRGRSVAKLTLDPLSYALLSGNSTSNNIHFPQAYKRYGIVGKQDSGLYLYLVEIEKLKPIYLYPSLYTQISTFFEVIDEHSSSDCTYYQDPKDDAAVLRYAAKTVRISKRFSNALMQLSDFIETYKANLDLHYDNIMVRPSTREIVINDPVVDSTIYSA